MKCSKQEVSRQVQRAEQLGWVLLKPNPDDGRSKRVCFSESGKDCLRQGLQQYAGLEERWEKRLGKEKVATLKQLLTEIEELIL